MTSCELKIFVSYSQLAVFDHSLERPFNDWTERHVAQGFAWRPGSVSFATLEEGGDHLVAVSLEDMRNDEPPIDAVRVIDVPFEVPPSGSIEIGSISDCRSVELPAGHYQLRFENYRASEGKLPRVHLLLHRDGNPHFRVIKAEIAAVDLLLTASPA